MSGEGKLSGIITNPNSETAGMGHQMNFNSIYSHGFARVAASTIVSSVANPTANAAAILDAAKECHEKSVTVALFPELCVSGYAIEDLLLQDALLDATERAVATIIEASVGFMTVLVFGAPLRNGSRIYNCAIVVHRGRILGVVPKTYLPTYREFYEARHFGSGRDADCLEISIGSMRAPFGTDLLFEADDVPGLVVGVEICEDMWIPVTPGSELALAGAIVLLNLSGSPITIGRARSRALLCQSLQPDASRPTSTLPAVRGNQPRTLHGTVRNYRCGYRSRPIATGTLLHGHFP
jgi:NAD+ synthase (glutamine-hydrolysing)